VTIFEWSLDEYRKPLVKLERTYASGLGILPDLYAIKRYGTGSGMTEVHALDGRQWYQAWKEHRATALGTLGPEWEVEMADYNNDGVVDLYCMRQASGPGATIEVHVFDGASGYQRALLHKSAGTDAYALFGSSADDLTYDLGYWDGDQIPDLYVISRDSASGKTAIRILAGDTAYTRYAYHTGGPTALHPAPEEDWSFEVGDYNADGVPDLYAIAKRNTGSGTTEIHVLDGRSNFQQFILHAGTALHQTDASWEFDVGDADGDGYVDVIGINKGSDCTKVHILDGATNYQSFALHQRTILHPCGDDFEFGIALRN
jgi:hypothetical protein